MSISKFIRGKGTFNCADCGKLTRATVSDNDELCPKCFDIAEHENSHSDNGYTSENCGWGEWHKGEKCPLQSEAERK